MRIAIFAIFTPKKFGRGFCTFTIAEGRTNNGRLFIYIFIQDGEYCIIADVPQSIGPADVGAAAGVYQEKPRQELIFGSCKYLDTPATGPSADTRKCNIVRRRVT